MHKDALSIRTLTLGIPMQWPLAAAIDAIRAPLFAQCH